MIRDVDNLKEGLKNGSISYFSLNQEEIEKVKEALELDIKKDKKAIEDIKNKIDIEKRKFENNNG